MFQLEVKFIQYNFYEKKENSHTTELTIFPWAESPYCKGTFQKQDPYQLPGSQKYDVHPNVISTWEKALF